MRKMNLNLQFFAATKEETHWFEKFKEEATDSDYKEATLALIEKVEALEGNETKKGIDDLHAEIEKALIPENFKFNLNRRLRVYESRLERAVADNFGSIVRHLRTTKGFSLRELEKKTGVTASYIQRIEAGRNKAPGIGVINKLSEALGENLLELLDPVHSDREGKIMPLQDLLIKMDYELNGEKADRNQREAVRNIFDLILTRDFKEMQTQDAMELVFSVMKLKETMK